MGIYNRDYFRDRAPSGSWGLDGLTPVVKGILIANIVVFLLQVLVTREERISPLEMMRRHSPELDKLLTEAEAQGPEAVEKLKEEYPELKELLTEKKHLSDLLYPSGQRVSLIQQWFELDTRKVMHGQVWRLLTHSFCHDRMAIWHIFMNMLLLYWFGGTLESMYGSREFLLFYLTAAVLAGLAFVGLDLHTGSTVPGIGASGAVMAVMMLYTYHYPRETICVFWLFPIEMRWVMLFYLLFDLHPVLLALAGDRMFTGIAHAAHLGGLVFGFLYGHYQWRLEPLLDRIHWPRWATAKATASRPRLRIAPMTYPDAEPELEPVSDGDQVDALLQKIYEQGEASLTEDERSILRQASERMKNRRKS